MLSSKNKNIFLEKSKGEIITRKSGYNLRYKTFFLKGGKA
jgi:hypothetical protein